MPTAFITASIDMSISRASISAVPLEDNTEFVIQMVASQPDTDEFLDPPLSPGKVFGFYNGATGFVELYVINNSGTRYLKC